LKPLWDFIDSYYGAVAVVLNILLVLSGVSLHAFFPDPIKTILSVVSLVLVGGFDYYLETTHERRHALRQHSVFIKSLLNAAASSILQASGAPAKHVRACLMMPDPKDDKLRIKYEYGFTGNDRDRHIEIPKGTGCCGQAWLQAQTMVGDLLEAPIGGMPEQWGLPSDQVVKIRKSLRSILSVPVWAGGENYQIVAVLNIDSDNEVDQIGFRKTAIQEIAYSFATVLGSLLDEQSP